MGFPRQKRLTNFVFILNDDKFHHWGWNSECVWQFMSDMQEAELERSYCVVSMWSMAKVLKSDLNRHVLYTLGPQTLLFAFFLRFFAFFAAPYRFSATPLGSRKSSKYDGWGQPLIRCLLCSKNIDFPVLQLSRETVGLLRADVRPTLNLLLFSIRR